jgi:hypothetical protein
MRSFYTSEIRQRNHSGLLLQVVLSFCVMMCSLEESERVGKNRRLFLLECSRSTSIAFSLTFPLM